MCLPSQATCIHAVQAAQRLLVCGWVWSPGGQRQFTNFFLSASDVALTALLSRAENPEGSKKKKKPKKKRCSDQPAVVDRLPATCMLTKFKHLMYLVWDVWAPMASLASVLSNHYKCVCVYVFLDRPVCVSVFLSMYVSEHVCQPGLCGGSVQSIFCCLCVCFPVCIYEHT